MEQQTEVVRHNFPNDAATVEYRVVADDELRLLHPIFERLGWPLPDPNFAKAIVAEAGNGDDKLVLGFQVVQFIPHAEPLWINPHVRGTGIAEGLVEETMHYVENDCKIKRYLCTAKPGSFAARLAEKYGMVQFPGALFVKQIPDKG